MLKTEIARRLARLANSPFIKIEASKFTEVGYVGRDVESMVRELTEVAVDMTKQSAFEEVRQRAEENVEERFWIFYYRHQIHIALILLTTNPTILKKNRTIEPAKNYASNCETASLMTV